LNGGHVPQGISFFMPEVLGYFLSLGVFFGSRQGKKKLPQPAQLLPRTPVACNTRYLAFKGRLRTNYGADRASSIYFL
jgi:hypothetical protein